MSVISGRVFDALPPGDYLAIALEYVLDGDWNDPLFLESLREQASRVSLREGENATIAWR